MAHLGGDLRYAARVLRKNAGFTAVAVLTLALGIGANTAIFTVVDAVLLRPLPFPEPGQLVQVWETNPRLHDGNSSIAPANLADWRDGSTTLEEIGAYQYRNVILTGDAEPERLIACGVSAGFFRALGVEPVLGRTVAGGEDLPGAASVAILGHGVWERRFGGDPSVLGREILLNDEKATIVGVMPPEFSFPNRVVDLWLPLGLDMTGVPRGRHFLMAVARVRAGHTIPEAQAEIDAIAARLEEDHPDTNRDMGAALVPLREEIAGSARPALVILLGAVGLVLLIACANVANLFLARATARRREVAIRGALGATRGRLVRQFLTESALLAAAGGALGVLLAGWGVDLLLALNPGGVPRSHDIGVDGRVLLFTLLVSLGASLLFGLLPALQASLHDPAEPLRDAGTRTTAGRDRRRLRHALVVTELALAVVLLVGGGLLLRSFLRLHAVPPGFSPESVLTMRIVLPDSRYPEPHQQAAFFRAAAERVAELPSVLAAGLAQDLPFAGSRSSESFEIEGIERPEGIEWNADYRIVTPDYPRALGIPLRRGRGLSPADTAEAPPVVLINETMARRYFGEADPIGRRLLAGFPRASCEIVGILGDVHHQQLDAEPEPEMYFPLAQRPFPEMFLAVRSAADPSALVAPIRALVRDLDPGQAVFSFRTMEDRLAGSVAPQRFQSALLGTFAGLALLLAVIGVYGVISYTVTQRTHEIGIRMALGAARRDVAALVVGQGLRLAAVGIGIGLFAALALSRTVEGLLFGVGPADPVTYLGTILLLGSAALLAAWLPARRAARVEPVTALRHE